MGIFNTGGPLAPDDVVNIQRKELEEILEQVERGDLYIALRSSRQTGKTTLLYQVRDKLHGKGYGVVHLDLDLLVRSDKLEFYQWICRRIEKELKNLLTDNRTIENIVNEQTFIDYLEAISEDTPQSPRIVLMLENLEKIPDDVATTFLSGIRWIFSAGKGPSGEIYKKLMFVFFGKLNLQKFITGNLGNVCRIVSLDDLSFEQTRSLVCKLSGLIVEKKKALAETIYHWANGHPYLTQRLCSLIENSPEYQNGVLKEPAAFVKSLVEYEIIYADPPDYNLNHIFRHLRDNETLRNLIFIGILRNDRGYCVIRNKIYRKALFNYIEGTSDG